MNPSSFTDEELRVKVAELCGLTKDADGRWYAPNHKHIWHQALLRLPDYCHDLNACHEMEKLAGENLMDADQWELYGKLLEKQHPTAVLAAPDGSIDRYDFTTLMCDLSARQRCNAFYEVMTGAQK